MASSLFDELGRIGSIVAKAKPSDKFSVEYQIYIGSPDWQDRRRRLGKNKRCGGCNTTHNLQLHHRVYPPRGAPLQAFIDQPDEQFTWLCQSCHQAIGKSMRQRRKPQKGKGKGE